MGVTVIVWLVIIAAILAALTGISIAVRRHSDTSDDTAPRRLRDPRDRGFFE